MTFRGASVVCLAVALLACGSMTATAAVPGPASRANPIVVFATGGVVGQMNFDTGFDESSANGIARAAKVVLKNGRTYRLHTCVWAKAPGRRPEARCETRTAKIDLLGALNGISAPTVGLGVPRPQAGQPSATIAGTVLLEEQQGDGWVSYASSWPQDGLPSAGIAVPAADQTTGTVLGPQGIAVAGKRLGGINTGAQDSICQGIAPATTGPSQGSTDALGSLDGPYEVQQATGKYAGSAARGTMLVLHGGTWQGHGRGQMETTREDVERWRARGWRTVNASYRPCGASIEDVLALHDRVRQTYGAKRPICASGQSAGAHLSLLLASLRPQLACAIVQAGPSDLTTTSGQPSESERLPVHVRNVIVSAFGADRLEQVSPARLGVKARVLYGIGAGDPLIPWSQASSFAKAQRARDRDAYVDTVHLAAGEIPWMHSVVSSAAISGFHAREMTLVKPLTAGAVSGPAGIARSVLRRDGLRVRYTCPTTCRVRVRLAQGGRPLASGAVKRAGFATGVITIRLGSGARKRLERGGLRLLGELRVDGKTRRFSSTIAAK